MSDKNLTYNLKQLYGNVGDALYAIKNMSLDECREAIKMENSFRIPRKSVLNAIGVQQRKLERNNIKCTLSFRGGICGNLKVGGKLCGLPAGKCKYQENSKEK